MDSAGNLKILSDVKCEAHCQLVHKHLMHVLLNYKEAAEWKQEREGKNVGRKATRMRKFSFRCFLQTNLYAPSVSFREQEDYMLQDIAELC